MSIINNTTILPNGLTPDLKLPAALTTVSAPTPTDQKVNEIAPVIIKKGRCCCKRFFRAIRKGFCRLGQIIKAIFKKIFCCCKKKKVEPQPPVLPGTLFAFEPTGQMASLPITPPIGTEQKPPTFPLPFLPSLVTSAGAVKPRPAPIELSLFQPPKVPSIDHLITKARSLSASLNTAVVLMPLPVAGQYNIGNSCYFNSAIQNLENLYAVHDPRCSELLNQNLTLKADESLEQMEERVLKGWSPIHDKLGVKKAEKLAELEQLEKELASIVEITTEGNAKRKTIGKKIYSITRQLREQEERILFKLTFLMISQAKKYGTSDQLEEALILHHNVCFTIKRHFEFEEDQFAQKDAAAYFELWHDQLGITTPMHVQRHGAHEGTWLQTSGQTDPENHLQVGIPQVTKEDYKELFGKEFNLINLIYDHFVEKTNAAVNACKFKLANGQEVAIANYYTLRKFACAPPPFLCVQVKRFANVLVEDNFVLQKNKEHIPLGFDPAQEQVDLNQFFRKELKQEEKVAYDLNGIVVHDGSLKGGHYYSYIKRGEKWFSCNDSYCGEVSIDEVPFERAYMYTFRRVPHPSNLTVS